MNNKYDVIIIGAGVAGLNAAYELASRGFTVAIIESKPRDRVGDKTCGDAIGVHHFKELGWEPPNSVIDHKYKGVKVYSPSEKYGVVVPGEGVSLNRVKFGQWMLKRAEDQGAVLLDKHVLVGVTYDENGIKSVKVKPIGKNQVIELFGKAFIDASGAKPALRTKLPLEWPISDRPYMTDYNIAYREVIELEKPLEEDNEYAAIYLNTEIAPGGYWWLFPKTPDGKVVNVGLGVIWGVNNYNPRKKYEQYLKKRFEGRLIHAGGGLVPTRRPLPTLVWKNVGVIGDAAYTANPVHGGGIGSSLQASRIVSKHLANALEEGEVDEYTMWRANHEYMRIYGAKQASLDVLRMYLQKLSNEDFEWILKNKIVDGRKIYDLGARASLSEEIIHNMSSLLKLLRRPSLLNMLRIVKNYMNKVKELYLDKYPDTPDKLQQWIEEADKIFDEYRQLIKYDPGSRVQW